MEDWENVPFRGGIVRVSRQPLPQHEVPRTSTRPASPEAHEPYGGFEMPGLDTMELEEAGLSVRSCRVSTETPLCASAQTLRTPSDARHALRGGRPSRGVRAAGSGNR